MNVWLPQILCSFRILIYLFRHRILDYFLKILSLQPPKQIEALLNILFDNSKYFRLDGTFKNIDLLCIKFLSLMTYSDYTAKKFVVEIAFSNK